MNKLGSYPMHMLVPAEKRRLMTKSFEHVQSRLLERHGITINKEQYGRILHKVQAMTGVVKLRTKQSGCVLYAMLFGEIWIPVLYDPSVRLVTTVYPRSVVEFYRRRITTLDEFLTRLQKQSCPTPSTPAELAVAIATIKAKDKELNEIRKAGA